MYACVYIPDFSVQAVVRGDPALGCRAVAIVDGAAPLLRVVALNDPARRLGIERGMTAVQVAQLGSRTAPIQVEIRRRSLAQEAATHAALLDCGYTVSPRLEDTAAHTLLLDLAGLQQLLGSPEKIAHKLARQVSGQGLEAHIAVAPNPDAALHAARGFPGITLIAFGEEADRLGGLPVEVLAPPPEMLETLHRWGVLTFRALAALPTGQLSERLGQEGVRLQTLARGAASRPLMPAQAALHFEEVMELEYVVTELEPLSFILGRLLNQLSTRLAARGLATNELKLQLELEDIGIRETQKSKLETGNWKLETGNSKLETGNSKFETHQSKIQPCEPRNPNSESRILRLPVPMRDSKVFLKLLQLSLQADPPRTSILKVAITANPVKPRAAQGGLFLPLSPDPEKLEVVLARIAGVVGKENVGSPQLLDTHRPDAFRMQHFAGAQETGNWKLEIGNWKLETGNSTFETRSETRNPESEIEVPEPRTPNSESCVGTTSESAQSKIQNLKSKITGPESHALMALRVFRPPVPAHVEVRAERPVRIFSACGMRGEIVLASGPWRTSGDWWTDKAWEHDEWDISVVSPAATQSSVVSRKKHQQTALYRIYCDLSNGSWFVQGTYD